MSGVSSDVRGLGGAMGVSLVASSTVMSEDWEGQWVWF